MKPAIWAAILMIQCFALPALPRADAQPSDPATLGESLKDGGNVLMIRHASAPGTSDPLDFRIGECATQRNLDGRGRTQAKEIGRWLRRNGVASARVFSSQWCRCLETAELLKMGPVAELPALNSFFDRPQDRKGRLSAMKAFLSEQAPDGALIILVTHQVNIAALTGEILSSGQGVVLRFTGGGQFNVRGTLRFEH
jgi:phosphohistidine phosphatase SixA